MCGIVGYVGPEPPVTAERLAAMRDTLAHRGPDDRGLWRDRAPGCAVGLAHRRLAIVDLAPTAAQPMARHGVHVVFNGEIYGHRALRATLGLTDTPSESDTEVIPALYRARGPAAVEALDGMFAFALWDPGERRLLLARDRLGIKPLFYAERPDGALLFASEIKALLASGAVDTAIDPQALHDYLGLTYVPGPRTLLRGVRQLPPGHTLTWRDGRTTLRRYWRPTLHSATSPAGARPAPTVRAAAAAVRAELVRAVGDRLMGDVPVGVFLSGGIDSAAILWALREAGARRPAFTVRFEDADFDESPRAAATARALGAEHHVETVRPDPAMVVDALAPAMDQPLADSSAIPLWYLCRAARRQVTVALGGDGGDEVFAGYRTHFAWALARVWRRMPRAVRAAATGLVGRLPVRHGKVGFDLKARAFVDAASRPAIEAHYRFKQFLGEDLRRALIRDPAPLAPTLRLFEAAARAPGAGGGLDAVLACDLALYLPDDILVKADRMSMLHGLELRTPLLDHRLVERVCGWPAGHKLRWPITKYVLRHALWGRVPRAVLVGRKAGFNVPMARWLNGPLAPLLDELLAPRRVAATGWLDPAPVQRLIAEHRGRHVDRSRPLWALLCLMLFERQLATFPRGRA